MADTELRSWLWVFGQWLRSINKIKLPKPAVTYDRWVEGDKRVLESRLNLLSEGDFRFKRPGAIATWNLVNRSFPTGGVLITLDNLYKLSSELPPSNRTELIRRGLERSLGLTHRFQVSWVVRGSAKFRFIIIDSFDVDLASQFVDEAPRDIVKYVALDAFSMRAIPNLSWQERIYHFPWYEVIRQLSPRKGCPENPRYRRLCKRIQQVTLS